MAANAEGLIAELSVIENRLRKAAFDYTPHLAAGDQEELIGLFGRVILVRQRVTELFMKREQAKQQKHD